MRQRDDKGGMQPLRYVFGRLISVVVVATCPLAVAVAAEVAAATLVVVVSVAAVVAVAAASTGLRPVGDFKLLSLSLSKPDCMDV